MNISVSVRDMTIVMAAIDPATPETPGIIANSVLFTLELTRYWSDTAAGTLAVSRPEHLRHSPPPPSFALDCQRRNRSAGVAARENHMERSFPRSGDGSYWHERCLTVADGKQLLRHKMVYPGATYRFLIEVMLSNAPTMHCG